MPPIDLVHLRLWHQSQRNLLYLLQRFCLMGLTRKKSCPPCTHSAYTPGVGAIPCGCPKSGKGKPYPYVTVPPPFLVGVTVLKAYFA